MSPEARCTIHACISLLRTLPGVTEETIQAVTHYLGIIVEYTESTT